MPSRRLRSRITLKICLTTRGARPSEGSSSRRSFGRLIQRAGNGQHLLLAAGEGAAALLQAFAQTREDGADFGEVFLEICPFL